jgi:hypothetical protein
VGRAIGPPSVNREQKALPFPLSNARRQLSAKQPGPNSRVAEVIVNVCKVVPVGVKVVTGGLLNEEEGV